MTESASPAATDRKRSRTERSLASPDDGSSSQRSLDGDDDGASQASTENLDSVMGPLTLVAETVAGVHSSVLSVASRQQAEALVLLQDVGSNASLASGQAAAVSRALVTNSVESARVRSELDAARADLRVKDVLLTNTKSRIASDLSRKFATLDVNSAVLCKQRAEIDALRRIQQLSLDNAVAVRSAFDDHERGLLLRIQQLEKERNDSRVTIARLSTALQWANEKSAGHSQEMVRMTEVLQEMCQASKLEGKNGYDIARTRAHVYLLEQKLSLEGIVEAIVPPEFVNARLRHQDVPPPPDPAIKQISPKFFALRLLQHKDVTLAELVDQWQQQFTTIEDLEEKLKEKTAKLEKLEKDAGRTHLLYMEERRRREAEERRVGELQRQRFAAGSDAALTQELDMIRLQLSTTLDTNALLTVQLRQNREENHIMSKKLDELRTNVEMLQKESERDVVVQSVARLKLHYEREARRLQCANEEIGTELVKRTAEVDQLKEQLHKAVGAYHTQKEAGEGLLDAMCEAERTIQTLQAQNIDLSQKIKTRDEMLASLSSPSPQMTKRHGSSETHPSLFSAKKNSQVIVSALNAILNKLEDYFALTARTLLPAECLHRRHETETETLQMRHRAEVNDLRRMVRAAMTFSLSQLEATEASRSYFIDAQVSDAACVTMLTEKLDAITAERDQLRGDARRYQEFIDRYGLAAVESVLMHEVSTDATTLQQDSADSVEEAAMLRAKVAEFEAVQKQINKALEEREGTIASLSAQLAISKADEKCAKQAADSWYRMLQLQRDSIARLTRELIEARAAVLAQLPSFPSVAHNDEELQQVEETGNREAIDRDVDGDGADEEAPTAHPTTPLAPLPPTMSRQLEPMLALMESIQSQLAAITAGSSTMEQDANGEVPQATLLCESAPPDAGASFERTVEEQITRHGISSVVALVRDIYETSSVIQSTRAISRGDDEAQAVRTSNLMQRTLERKVAGLEDVLKQRDEEINKLQLSAIDQTRDRDKRMEESFKRVNDLAVQREQELAKRRQELVQVKAEHSLEVESLRAQVAELAKAKNTLMEVNNTMLNMLKVRNPQGSQTPAAAAAAAPTSGPVPAVASPPTTLLPNNSAASSQP